MKRRVNKGYCIHKLVFILVEYILPIISGILVVASFSLEYGVKKYMGLHRDLVYRNRLLTSTILSPSILNLYQWIVGIGLMLSLIIYFKRKKWYSQYSRRFRINSYEKKLSRILILISLISIVWLITVFYYPNSSLIAYPWIILSILTVIITQYIRFINLYYKKK